jgi:hypothetical protein
MVISALCFFPHFNGHNPSIQKGVDNVNMID